MVEEKTEKETDTNKLTEQEEEKLKAFKVSTKRRRTTIM